MSTAAADSSIIRTGVDHIECYRTMARRCDLAGAWKVLVRGRVVQRRPDNLRRKLLKKLLCQAMKPSEEQLASPIFHERLESFLVLACPKTRVTLQFGHRTRTLKKRSKHSGMFQQTIDIATPDDFTAASHVPQSLAIAPVIQGDDEKDALSPNGAQAQLISPIGVSVISDIDDTVKVTRVGNRRDMLVNTFVNPFRAVEGIQSAYERWENAGAAFHYVSSSPWQLYKPLVEFIDRDQFPSGSLHLRNLKLQGPSILKLLSASKRSKKKAIKQILAWYPGRQFVLVGDAGEKDPEIYGSVARKHPVQVAGIFIRRIETANMSRARFQRAFRRLPDGLGRIYDDPAELAALMPAQRSGIPRWTTVS